MLQDAAQRFLEKTLVPFLPKLAAAVAILLICWLVSAITKRIIRGFAGVHRLDESLAGFLSRMASTVFWIVGIVMALGTVDIDATALVAGLGLTGFAVGFALKDVISNTLGTC